MMNVEFTLDDGQLILDMLEAVPLTGNARDIRTVVQRIDEVSAKMRAAMAAEAQSDNGPATIDDLKELTHELID